MCLQGESVPGAGDSPSELEVMGQRQCPEQSAGAVSDPETGSTASALLGGLKGRQAELVTGHRDGWECTGLLPSP